MNERSRQITSIIRKLSLFVVCLLILVGCSSKTSVKTSTLPVIPSTAVSTTGFNTSSTVLEVYFLDVGQGDSEILRYGDSTMLIDAGTNQSTNTLLADIKNLGITKFNVIIATHPHEDHIGGLDGVINLYPFDEIFMPKTPQVTTKTFQDVLTAIKNKSKQITSPIPGSVLNFGDCQCTILAPNSQNYDDLNNYSIVLKLVFKNVSFLFTGDAQVLSENEMLAKGYNLKADVLKVGHHGSETSTSLNFLNAVAPKYAAIEVGAGNDYGHPKATTLQKLAAANVNVYRTDLNGTIRMFSDGSTIQIGTAK
ncbi:MAG TPA: ComEC/Rec2 family competence protein [Dehalococcoidales bacterium]|nr:ComEC/Rec2 family competence protein [Dehalococcoidales bacterium]